MKDEVVAYSTSSREGAEKQPLDLTAEGALSNPYKWKWALCCSAIWKNQSYFERGLWEFQMVRRKSAPEVSD